MKKMLMIIIFMLFVSPLLAQQPIVAVLVDASNLPVLNSNEEYQYTLTYLADPTLGGDNEVKIKTEEEIELAISVLEEKQDYLETIKAEMLSRKSTYQIGPGPK